MKKHDTQAYFEGQIMALATILRSVLLTLPERDVALHQAKAQLEYLRTSILPSRMPEETLEGIDRIDVEVLGAP